MVKKSFSVIATVSVSFVLLLLCTPFAHAATLSAVSDKLSTSRPSASAYINAAYGSSDSVVTIVNNGSRYLASDSARIIGSPGNVIGNQVTVASQSADLTGVYLANSTGTAAGSSTYKDLLIAPITAKHTISFTTINAVAAGGKIVITFPGTGSNIASPSASTFSFNGLTSGNISYSPSAGSSTCSSFVISAPSITCTIATATLDAGVTVTLTLGSSTPALINPTKSGTAGTNDAWTMTIQTTDSGGVTIDDARISIGTIETVKVSGDVDPSLTFSIAGIAASTSFSSQVSSCNGSDSTQNTPSSSATDVSLGFLRNGSINIAGQVLTVSTNGSQGYTISATSSGQFINPSTGYWIYGLNSDTALSGNDTPAPATFRASGLEGFGLSACGSRVTAGTWGATNCTTAFSSGCKYSNPFNTGTNSYYATLASYSGGAISNEQTAVKYAGSISGATAPGTYRTMVTYVATATF